MKTGTSGTTANQRNNSTNEKRPATPIKKQPARYNVVQQRRTAAIASVESSRMLSITGKTLGHTTAQATQVYARLDTTPVLAAMETAHDKMFEGVEM